MKKYIYILLVLLLGTNLGFGQISINAKIAPQKGDVLKMILTDGDQLDIGSSGEDKLWNFSQLRGGILRQIKYSSLEEKDTIKADLKSQGYDGVVYLVQDDLGLYESVKITKDPIFGIPNSVIRYKEPKLVRPFKLNYNNYFNFNSDFDLYLTHDNIPKSIKSFLPFVKDTVKLSVHIATVMNVDAWGKMILESGNTYDVLRLKETNTYNANLYIKSESQWVEVEVDDVTELEDKMKNRVIEKYHFYNNLSKEPIALAWMGKHNEIRKLLYKDTDSALVLPTDKGETKVYLYPNPSFGAINAVFINVKPGNYTIRISNILGKKIWSQDYKLDRSGIFKENLSYLSKGPYLYTITGPNGNRLVTRKITILKP